MKIGQLESKAITPAVNERRAPASAAGSAGGEASAKVQLSTTATQLAGSGSEGVFDAEKVQRISDAIREGRFEVNADKIADKLIANAQEMLGQFGKA